MRICRDAPWYWYWLINNRFNRSTRNIKECFCISSRADLLSIYEQVILTDIEFSDSQNLDQALWKNVFYQVIERFRQLLKDPTHDNVSHIRNMLLTLLDEVRDVWDIHVVGCVFVRCLKLDKNMWPLLLSHVKFVIHS